MSPNSKSPPPPFPQQYVATPQELAEAADLDFKPVKEEWQIYKLEDGTTFQLKVTMFGMKRLKVFNPIDGTPLYAPAFRIDVRVTNVPTKLKSPMQFKEK